LYSWRVPLTLFGDVKITASYDLGDLGPVEGKPVIYHLSVATKARSFAAALGATILAFGPWVFLLVLLLLPANRNLRAWAVLAPIGVLWLALSLTTKIPMTPHNRMVLEDFVLAIQWAALGLGGQWLLSHHLGGRNRLVMLVIAAITLALAIVAGNFSSILPRGGHLALSLISAVVGIEIMIGLAVAGIVCRKRYGLWRFVFWTALGLLLANGLCGIILVGIQILFDGRGALSVWQCAVVLGLFDTVMTLLCLIVLFPFLILTFNNRLYRARFCAIFRLPGMVEATKAETAAPESATVK